MDKKAFVTDFNDRPEYQRVIDPVHTCGMKAGRVWLEPGSECGLHSTGDREEALVFLAGQGMARAGGEEFTVGAGRICYIPPQTEHNILNTGADPLVYVFCVVPVR